MNDKIDRIVLDTTALIFLNDFSPFKEIYTVQEVVEEVKDRLTSMKLTSLLKRLKIVDPNKDAVEEVSYIAEKTGDIEKLSKTDIKVLALAKQLTCPIMSDDYAIQNVAGHAGIKYISIFNKGIKSWSKEGNRKI